MAVKNTAQVVIGGKIITLGGYESEEYFQKVASYINNKIAELSEMPGYTRPVSYTHLDVYKRQDLVYPLSQHIGAPSVPCVKKGDTVLAGQKIADAGGFVSVPLHASVSGTVKGIEKRLNATGSMVDCIVIENDQQYQETEFQEARLEDLTKEEILNRIKEGGVVGMGGAGFPTHVKLAPKDPSKIEYILVNGAECEPYITSDYRRMIEEPEKVVKGLQVILTLFDSAKGYICIEDNKPDCIAKMKELVKDIDRIEVKEMMTKYPQGGERTLIYAATGREINSSMLPADVGCVVDNVETVILSLIHIYRRC